MAKRQPRYEFTQGWLFETEFKRVRGLDYPAKGSYTKLDIARIDKMYYEKVNAERFAHQEKPS